MAEEASIQLVARWQQGDQQAAGQLFRRYEEQLVALTRGRLSAKLAQRIDPEDVVQSAYRSFFSGARNGAYELERGGDLWRLLAGITLNKLRHQVRRNTTGKRAMGRERDLAGADPGVLLRATEPSPVEAVALVDELEQLMRRLDPTHRRILELRLQGYNLEEIATQTERTERTVSRVLERVRDDLQAQQERTQEGG